VTTTTYDIQSLVSQSGVPRRTIHFYVQQGILPPPQGAGPAAYYTEDHLVRLQLIPMLRQQGLRLDDIRRRFMEMDPEAMRQALADGQESPVGLEGPPGSPVQRQNNGEQRARFVREHLPGYQPGYQPPSPAPAASGEQRFTHYSLPAGITLVVPEPLNSIDRQRVALLLQTARQIFSGGAAPRMARDDPSGQNAPTNQEE
jgi:DNA-binding transcriptional MerR regulator